MIDRKYRRARIWSNEMLKKHAYLFKGDIVNVSAWKDMDKCGRKYKEYFVNADNYYITNYGGYRGICGETGEILLDLEENLPEELIGRFDVVFNHTTLEHIFELEKAFKNICSMSREVVILVVPFAQIQHITTSYKDYWRFTPYSLNRLFEKNGFTMIICEHNNLFNAAVYLYCISIKNNMLEKYSTLGRCDIESMNIPGRWIGAGIKDFLQSILIKEKINIHKEKHNWLKIIKK